VEVDAISGPDARESLPEDDGEPAGQLPAGLDRHSLGATLLRAAQSNGIATWYPAGPRAPAVAATQSGNSSST
jgi:hypothetical protein